MYQAIFTQFKKQLKQLDAWLGAAEDFAKSKNFDSQNYLGMRLAVDQLAFTRQVQVTCDTAKLGAARLVGMEAPKHDDAEKSVADLRARVASTLAFLETITDFAGADTRAITQPRWEGKHMTGANYFLEHVLPNFYFHLSHTYAILRHAGVPLGKRDYLGALTQY
jgi:uncharacterized protein